MMRTRRDSYPIAGLGQRLRQARKQAGYYQGELARLLNCDQTSISLYEQDKRAPSLQTLVACCHLIGVTPNHLLGWDSIPEATTDVDYDTSFVRRNFRAKE